MRRLIGILALAAVVVAAVLAVAASREGDRGARFSVELDNAFGLVEGGDLKVAGVRAGRIIRLRLDRRTKRALVDFEITERGFGSLRADVRCDARPQSLIGEYFLDCLPGTARRRFPEGGTIPVRRTTSTVPVDLLQNVLRRPYRERLRIILDELGAGVGARAEDLNASIRRLSPALRETDKVLALLADQNRTLVSLTEDADTVIGDLAENRQDVGRWVTETRQTAEITAGRRAELAEGFRRLPAFLRELRPTMGELGRVADAQVPALDDLRVAAPGLRRLLRDLQPFTEATRANLRSLAPTARTGRRAVRAARPAVAELSRASKRAPELAGNLAIVGEDLADRDRAVEADPRSPEGRGYTGLEAFFQYAFDQALAINVYDDNGYILKVNAFEDKCSAFQNADSVKEEERREPGFIQDCLSGLGPNQPGVLQADPTTSRRGAPARRRAGGTRERDRDDDRDRDRDRGRDRSDAPSSGGDDPPGGGGAGSGSGGAGPRVPEAPSVDDLVPDLPGIPTPPPVPAPSLPDPGRAVPDVGTDRSVLDFLLAP